MMMDSTIQAHFSGPKGSSANPAKPGSPAAHHAGRSETQPPTQREGEAQSEGRLLLEGDELPTLDTIERRYVAHVLEATGGNKTKAAKILGVDRRTLYRKLERWAQLERSAQ